MESRKGAPTLILEYKNTVFFFRFCWWTLLRRTGGVQGGVQEAMVSSTRKAASRVVQLQNVREVGLEHSKATEARQKYPKPYFRLQLN